MNVAINTKRHTDIPIPKTGDRHKGEGNKAGGKNNYSVQKRRGMDRLMKQTDG